MCGIVGVWHLDGRPVDEAELIAARDRLVRRGPDDQGVFVSGDVGLGHRRLSIIDLSALGRMPMSNEDKTVWAVFNGEIYNFEAIRAELLARGYRFRSRTDSEVIVHAYDQWGTDCFARFDGMFSIAIWDGRNRRVVLARDITGEKPLYYCHLPGRSLWFASTILALLGFADVPRRIDAIALEQYLGFGFVPAPASILESVRKVEPGTFVVVNATDAPRSTTYWSLSEVFARPRRTTSLERATDEILEVLRRAVRSRLVADVPLGAFLSGGIDSSLVVALMAEVDPGAVRTFTIGFQEKEFDESAHAQRIAEHLGVANTVTVLTARDVLRELPEIAHALDEPMADYSALPSLAVARMARQHVTVALTGDGADEAFGGYRYYAGTRLFERIAGVVPAALRHAVAKRAHLVPNPRLRRALQRTSVADGAAYFGRSGFYRGATANGSIARILRRPVLGRPEDVVASFIRSQLRGSAAETGMLWDATHTLPDAWLTKVDRTSMAVSLETRAPFLAREVLELAFSLPFEYRIHGTAKKVILRRVLSRYLPTELYERPKQGFTAPMRQWFSGELKAELHARLAPEQLDRFGIIDSGAVKELLAEQMAGSADHTQLLWALFHLDCWRETHIG